MFLQTKRIRANTHNSFFSCLDTLKEGLPQGYLLKDRLAYLMADELIAFDAYRDFLLTRLELCTY